MNTITIKIDEDNDIYEMGVKKFTELSKDKQNNHYEILTQIL